MKRNSKKQVFSKGVKEFLELGLLFFSTILSLALFGGIAFFLIKNGLSALNILFFTSKVEVLKGQYGIWEYLINTIGLLFLTVPLAGILGVLGAVYLFEYARDGKIVQIIHLAIEILAGVPSIVFGLFGMVFFGEVLHMGYSLLTGSLTLTLMVLPVIIENTKEILQTIPKAYRQGALGLGAQKWQLVSTILLPGAVPGIATGITLSIGKILGESAALLFTAGSKGSLSVALYMMLGKGKMKESYSIALVLLLFMVFLNLLVQYIKEKR